MLDSTASGTPFTVSNYFNIELMERVFQARINSDINQNYLEKIFSTGSIPIQEDTERITAIVYGEEAPLEKAFQLRNLYLRRLVEKNSQEVILRNIARLLFAKLEWFEANPELAQRIFPNQKFDELFFQKRVEHIHLFKKKHSVH